MHDDETGPVVLDPTQQEHLVDVVVCGALHGAIAFLETLRAYAATPGAGPPDPTLRLLPAPKPEPVHQATPSAIEPANSNAPDELIDEKELCALVGISPVTATKWRARAEGPRFVKVGRLVRYRRADVLAWLASRTRG